MAAACQNTHHDLAHLLETVAEDSACSATVNKGPDRARALGRGSARMTEFTESSLARSLCTWSGVQRKRSCSGAGGR